MVDYGIQMLLDKLGAARPEEWHVALERTLSLLREHRTLVLNVYRAYERSYVESHVRRWAAPLVEARTRLAARSYAVTEDQIGFMTELLTQGLASIVLSWVEQGMPSNMIERMDDFDILVGAVWTTPWNGWPRKTSASPQSPIIRQNFTSPRLLSEF